MKNLVPTKNKKNKNDKRKKNKKDNESEYSEWTFPKEQFDDGELKLLFAEALAIIVSMIMNNHVYMFGNDIILQEN